MRGATQNNHNCPNAQPPANKAGPVLRAGLTEVLVTGMLMRWMSTNPRPMAIGAKPAGASLSVDPSITTRKKKVSTISATRAENSELPPGECSP